MKAIAVDLDDTLSNFTETLLTTEFVRDASNVVPEDVFQDYLAKIRSGIPDTSDLLSNEFSSFRGKIILKCHELAVARADGIEFMQWLRDNRIPYDYLFMAWNKLEYCRAWNIDYLIDDQELNILYGAQYGVKVFYPILPKHTALTVNEARGFKSFDEVRQWIQS